MTALDLFDAVDEAIAACHMETTWWRRWRERKRVVLWLSGRGASVPALQVRPACRRPVQGGGTEYGYTLAQVEQIRDWLAEVFHRTYVRSFTVDPT